MRRVKIKPPSIPAIIIVSIIASGVGAYSVFGPESQSSLTSPQDKLIQQELGAGDTRMLFGAIPLPIAMQQPAGQPAMPPMQSNGFSRANMAQWIKPAVASIYITNSVTDFNPPTGGTMSSGSPLESTITTNLGSGIVIHPSGLILTNNHMIEMADNIMVNIPSLRTPQRAEVLHVDPKSDLCILKINVNYPLPVAPIHRANHVLAGESLIAVSLKPNLSADAHRSAVSSVGDRVTADGKLHQDLISLDRPLGIGFDGAPLIDENGFVVGIIGGVSRGGQSDGRMATSTKTIHRFLARFMERPEMAMLVNNTRPLGTTQPIITRQASPATVGMVRERPLATETATGHWIGVNFQNLEAVQAAKYGSPFPTGAMVNFVHPFGPAVNADILPGDIVLKANGRIVRGGGDIDAAIERARGGKVTLQLFRKGKRLEVSIPTAEKPTAPAQPVAGGMNGMAQTVALPTQPQMQPQMQPQRPMNMDRMMANQKKQMIIQKYGLNPSLMNMNIDGDRLMRMAKEKLLSDRLGIPTARNSTVQGGTNFNRQVDTLLHEEVGRRLGIRFSASMLGVGREQMIDAARIHLLAERLELPPSVATMQGITETELIKMAVDNHVAGKLGMTVNQARNMTTPPPTAVVTPPVDARRQPVDRDTMARMQMMDRIITSMSLEPSLANVPGMTPNRLLDIAGNRFIADMLGVDRRYLSMPGMNREKIINSGMNRVMASRLGVQADATQLARMTSADIIRNAENQILVTRLGLPQTALSMPGVNRNRLLKVAADQLMAAAWQ